MKFYWINTNSDFIIDAFSKITDSDLLKQFSYHGFHFGSSLKIVIMQKLTTLYELNEHTLTDKTTIDNLLLMLKECHDNNKNILVTSKKLPQLSIVYSPFKFFDDVERKFINISECCIKPETGIFDYDELATFNIGLSNIELAKFNLGFKGAYQLCYKLKKIKEINKMDKSLHEIYGLKRLYIYLDETNSVFQYLSSLDNLIELQTSIKLSASDIQEICKLTNLKSLTMKGVSYCQSGIYRHELDTLPSEVGNLINLEKLNLSDNHLTYLPCEIGKLTKLIYFELYGNNLTSLPDEFSNLIDLQKLSLYGNKLKTIPTVLNNLTNLKYLELGNNDIESITDEIPNLINLEKLHLQHNKNLESVSDILGNFINLKELDLSFNKLIIVPCAMSKLVKLEKLQLRKTQITKLFPGLNNLVNLKHLDISDNNFSSLPIEIYNMTNLEYLHFENINKKTMIFSHESIRNLYNLHSLNLQYVSFPKTEPKKNTKSNTYTIKFNDISISSMDEAIECYQRMKADNNSDTDKIKNIITFFSLIK